MWCLTFFGFVTNHFLGFPNQESPPVLPQNPSSSSTEPPSLEPETPVIYTMSLTPMAKVICLTLWIWKVNRFSVNVLRVTWRYISNSQWLLSYLENYLRWRKARDLHNRGFVTTPKPDKSGPWIFGETTQPSQGSRTFPVTWGEEEEEEEGTVHIILFL